MHLCLSLNKDMEKTRFALDELIFHKGDVFIFLARESAGGLLSILLMV